MEVEFAGHNAHSRLIADVIETYVLETPGGTKRSHFASISSCFVCTDFVATYDGSTDDATPKASLLANTIDCERRLSRVLACFVAAHTHLFVSCAVALQDVLPTPVDLELFGDLVVLPIAAQPVGESQHRFRLLISILLVCLGCAGIQAGWLQQRPDARAQPTSPRGHLRRCEGSNQHSLLIVARAMQATSRGGGLLLCSARF